MIVKTTDELDTLKNVANEKEKRDCFELHEVKNDSAASKVRKPRQLDVNYKNINCAKFTSHCN